MLSRLISDRKEKSSDCSINTKGQRAAGGTEGPNTVSVTDRLPVSFGDSNARKEYTKVTTRSQKHLPGDRKKSRFLHCDPERNVVLTHKTLCCLQSEHTYFALAEVITVVSVSLVLDIDVIQAHVFILLCPLVIIFLLQKLMSSELSSSHKTF